MAEETRTTESRRYRSNRGGFFEFRTMITASLIKILYVIGMLLVSLAGIYMIAQPFVGTPPLFGPETERLQQSLPLRFEHSPHTETSAPGQATEPIEDAPENMRPTDTAASVVVGAVVLVVGNILWRVYCELIIVLFSIHEILGSVEAELRNRA